MKSIDLSNPVSVSIFFIVCLVGSLVGRLIYILFIKGRKIMDIKLIGILIVIFVVIDLIYWFITKGGHKNGNK